MGYEIKVIYHPKKESGFDVSQRLEKTKRIGKASDGRMDDKLAIEILRQFSRRDILVEDIEVVEFVKKPLKIKPSVNGSIIIRGQRYSLDGSQTPSIDQEDDGGECSDTEEGTEEGDSKPPAATPSKVCPTERPKVNPIRRETFDPPLQVLDRFKKEGWIPGQTYDIMAEEVKGFSPNTRTTYLVRRPDGREIKIPGEYFVSEGGGLIWQGVADPGKVDVSLAFPGEVGQNAPILRK